MGSHVYNAWLAQLIEKGKAPGLYLARQWNNVLFDIALLRVADLFGFAAAEKIVVAACVLVFFWGVFAFVTAVTGRSPWFLLPCIAILVYGYSFSMGFFNYYLSIGLACFALALIWQGRAEDWLLATAILPLVFFAHPLGFLWFVGTASYRLLRRWLPGWLKFILPISIAVIFFVLHWYLLHRVKFEIDWGDQPFYLMNGADQLALYGHRYVVLACVAFSFGAACVAVDAILRKRDFAEWSCFIVPLELYWVTFCATSLLPENLRPPTYAGWIGLLVSRLTIISAIFGLCVLGCLRPRRWHLMGFAALAATFFGWLYTDTAWLNRMEENASGLLAQLPYGTRIIPTLAAPSDWRVPFIGHIADRACIGHCFTYSNYEASSGQFRVRIRQRNPIETNSADDSEDMEGGAYEIQDTDPPLKQLYQNNPQDLLMLALHDLAEGETTGRFGIHRTN